ncbi:aldolase [bacterium]|nr:MAG: aldolase [bacterium]
MAKSIRRIVEEKSVHIPASVPQALRKEYEKNYLRVTASSGRLFLFAADQKLEHLNHDFVGKGIAKDAANPEHLFEIASKGRIGAFATQLGLISKYGSDYPDVSYIVKMNGKTNVVPTSDRDPVSRLLCTIDDVLEFKKNSGLTIAGIGYTLYVGSIYEADMLAEAAQVIYQAQRHGLVTVLWCYPRGKAVKNELHENMIAGAAGVGAALGADFVKVNAPDAANGFESAQRLVQATHAAGRTKVICAGGPSKDPKAFLEDLYHQIHTGGTNGIAIGRNIFQKPLKEALNFCKAVAKIVIDDGAVEKAKALLGEK